MEVITKQEHIDTIKRLVNMKQAKQQEVNTIMLVASVQRMYKRYDNCKNLDAIERDIARIIFS